MSAWQHRRRAGFGTDAAAAASASADSTYPLMRADYRQLCTADAGASASATDCGKRADKRKEDLGTEFAGVFVLLLICVHVQTTDCGKCADKRGTGLVRF